MIMYDARALQRAIGKLRCGCGFPLNLLIAAFALVTARMSFRSGIWAELRDPLDVVAVSI